MVLCSSPPSGRGSHGDGDGIDCMLISVTLAQLMASPEVKKDIAAVAHIMEVSTLAMSAS
jgi:hypothetical protein